MTYAQARLAAIRARKAAEKTQAQAQAQTATPYMQTRNAIVNAHREQAQSTLENTSMNNMTTVANQVRPFLFESKEIRVVNDANGEPLFVAKDVLAALGYAVDNVTNRINHVPEEWRGSNRITTTEGVRMMSVLTEQGLYFFLGRSDKPKALPFQKWLAGEVVPSIRKTGAYSMQPTPVIPATYTEALRLALAQAEELERKQAALDYAAPRCREAQPTALPCVHL